MPRKTRIKGKRRRRGEITLRGNASKSYAPTGNYKYAKNAVLDADVPAAKAKKIVEGLVNPSYETRLMRLFLMQPKAGDLPAEVLEKLKARYFPKKRENK